MLPQVTCHLVTPVPELSVTSSNDSIIHVAGRKPAAYSVQHTFLTISTDDPVTWSQCLQRYVEAPVGSKLLNFLKCNEVVRIYRQCLLNGCSARCRW